MQPLNQSGPQATLAQPQPHCDQPQGRPPTSSTGHHNSATGILKPQSRKYLSALAAQVQHGVVEQHGVVSEGEQYCNISTSGGDLLAATAAGQTLRAGGRQPRRNASAKQDSDHLAAASPGRRDREQASQDGLDETFQEHMGAALATGHSHGDNGGRGDAMNLESNVGPGGVAPTQQEAGGRSARQRKPTARMAESHVLDSYLKKRANTIQLDKEKQPRGHKKSRNLQDGEAGARQSRDSGRRPSLVPQDYNNTHAGSSVGTKVLGPHFPAVVAQDTAGAGEQSLLLLQKEVLPASASQKAAGGVSSMSQVEWIFAGGQDSTKMAALLKWGKKNGMKKVAERAAQEFTSALPDPKAEAGRLYSFLQVEWRSKYRHLPFCVVCSNSGAQLRCKACYDAYHGMCLDAPVADVEAAAQMEGLTPWICRTCGKENEYAIVQPENPRYKKLSQAEIEARLGLTPDWMIAAIAHKVFLLPELSQQQPFIRGLLDPCTNDKVSPNIPAELIYDQKDDGLARNLPWAGYFVILNPPYHSAYQWRFVNRAIDEVESAAVPAVVLLSRNSTDTAYFQRLRPYPRVHLRRTAARFKDYENTPHSFGVSVCLIATPESYAARLQLPKGNPQGPSGESDGLLNLIRRFIQEFEKFGEPNMPIDSKIVETDVFDALLGRLRQYTYQHQRDHWLHCTACGTWRLVEWEQVQRATEAWTCSELNCATSVAEVERCGPSYVSKRLLARQRKAAPEEEKPTLLGVKRKATDAWQQGLFSENKVPREQPNAAEDAADLEDGREPGMCVAEPNGAALVAAPAVHALVQQLDHGSDPQATYPQASLDAQSLHAITRCASDDVCPKSNAEQKPNWAYQSPVQDPDGAHSGQQRWRGDNVAMLGTGKPAQALKTEEHVALVERLDVGPEACPQDGIGGACGGTRMAAQVYSPGHLNSAACPTKDSQGDADKLKVGELPALAMAKPTAKAGQVTASSAEGAVYSCTPRPPPPTPDDDGAVILPRASGQDAAGVKVQNLSAAQDRCKAAECSIGARGDIDKGAGRCTSGGTRQPPVQGQMAIQGEGVDAVAVVRPVVDTLLDVEVFQGRRAVGKHEAGNVESQGSGGGDGGGRLVQVRVGRQL